MRSKMLFLLLSILVTSLSSHAQSAVKPMQDGKMVQKTSNTEPLKVGDIAPDFKLNDQNGKAIQLSKAKTPVILVFYRGYW